MGFLLQVLLFNPVPGFHGSVLNADTSPFSGIQKFEPAVPVIITNCPEFLKYYVHSRMLFPGRSDVSEDCNEYFLYIHSRMMIFLLIGKRLAIRSRVHI
jgi:hypothetical protein